jgi:sec-independent protein translocase protein TatC
MRKSFFEHLKELNLRIIISFALIFLFSIFVYLRYTFFIEILNEPLVVAGYDQSNIFALTIYEGFQVKITNVFLISLVLLLPLTILNLNFFFKPALIDSTWFSFILYNLFFTVFYYLGVYTAINLSSYGIEFLLSFNENEVILRSQNYYQFIIRLTFLFAITFQLPLITLFLLNKKILNTQLLTNNRPELFIFILVLSAIVTPTGDPLTLFAFTLPLYLLMEIIIFIHKKISK